MVSVETLREQFSELGVEPNDEIINKCKWSKRFLRFRRFNFSVYVLTLRSGNVLVSLLDRCRRLRGAMDGVQHFLSWRSRADSSVRKRLWKQGAEKPNHQHKIEESWKLGPIEAESVPSGKRRRGERPAGKLCLHHTEGKSIWISSNFLLRSIAVIKVQWRNWPPWALRDDVSAVN